MAFLGLETFAQKGIFVLYMSVSLGFGLLNQHVKSVGIEFNSATAVLLQCLLKILLSTYLYLRQDGTPRDLLARAIKHRRVFFLYTIPAALYAAYDILSYVNLRRLDLTTCYLLMNSRLVVSGLIRQVMFKQRLGRGQWIALVVIMEGCAIKIIGDNSSAAVGDRVSLVSFGLVFLQILASQVANVYNELLLKKQSDVPLHLQNLFLYLNSVLPILLISASGVTGQSLREAVRSENLRVMLHPAVFAMVLIMSVLGLVTGALLKILDSVRKAIASALELVMLPLFSALLFRLRITPHLVCAAAMVSSGVYLYSIPAGAKAKRTTRSMGGDGNHDKVDVECQSPADSKRRTIELPVGSNPVPGRVVLSTKSKKNVSRSSSFGLEGNIKINL